MKKIRFIFSAIVIITILVSFIKNNETQNLRKIYSKPPSQWPAPLVVKSVKWTELGILPASPIESKKDTLKDLIELGKILFFDTRLSGSGKISCATCHQPELSWTDGKQRSAGHEGAITKRNSPTIQNSWFYKRLFWDGRAKDLADQAFAPINSETEMHNEMPAVMRSIRKSDTYKKLFKKAFGDDDIGPDQLTEAIATFEKTIVSRKSRFDEFLEGNKKALSDEELRGLHVFRTKAGCMNCHHGPLLTDNSFHNNGFSKGDKGLYNVTHKDEDTGKLKTPSLRDVMKTGPWMHDGSETEVKKIISKYLNGPDSNDPLLKAVKLSPRDKKDLLAFLHAISAAPLEFERPVLPAD
jgi:cytochrome c peroxidase